MAPALIDSVSSHNAVRHSHHHTKDSPMSKNTDPTAQALAEIIMRMDGKLAGQRMAIKMLAQALEQVADRPLQAEISNELTKLIAYEERRDGEVAFKNAMIEEMQELADFLGGVV